MTAAAAKADIGHNSKAVGELLEDQPELVFSEPGILAQLLESIEADIAKQGADVSTEKARKALKSLAFGIAKRKTAIDAAGKALNVDLRKKIDVTDKVRREAWDKLEALQFKAKAPADAWDKKEDERKQYVTETRSLYADAMRLPFGSTFADIADMVRQIETRAIHPEMLADLLDVTVQEQKTALGHLADLEARLRKDEADRAELERLRTEKAEAERKATEAAAAEAKKKADDERIAAAAKRAADEAVEAERKKAQEAAAAVERERAAEQAKRDAEAAAERRKVMEAEAAREAAAAAERKKAQDAIDEANRKAKAAEEALEADRRAEAARVAAAAKAKAEQEAADAARKRNQEHRAKIMGAAKTAIMEHGKVEEDAARLIVLAIVAGSIPNVSLEF